MKHNKYLIANDPATKIPDHYAILTNGNYYFMRFHEISYYCDQTDCETRQKFNFQDNTYHKIFFPIFHRIDK